jgi:hypothetical protein
MDRAMVRREHEFVDPPAEELFPDEVTRTTEPTVHQESSLVANRRRVFIRGWMLPRTPSGAPRPPDTLDALPSRPWCALDFDVGREVWAAFPPPVWCRLAVSTSAP